MKRPSCASPRKLSENASTSLCSTILTSKFFGAFEGLILSKSSIREVPEVNVNFVTT